jgi:hypothetical protein
LCERVDVRCVCRVFEEKILSKRKSDTETKGLPLKEVLTGIKEGSQDMGYGDLKPISFSADTTTSFDIAEERFLKMYSMAPISVRSQEQ